MKLAKKMLACVMALAMVAALGVVAFAADAPALSLSADSAKVGETFKVVLKASNLKDIQTGKFQVTFDPSVVQFVASYTDSIAEEDAETAEDKAQFAATKDEKFANGITIEAGLVPETTNTVSSAFAFSGGSKTKSATLVVMTFKALKAGNANFKAVATDAWTYEGGQFDADKIAAATLAGTVTEAAAPTTAAPTTAAPTTAAPTTAAPTTKDPAATKPGTSVPQTGSATAVAAVAGVMAIAAVAFVATRKKDEE